MNQYLRSFIKRDGTVVPFNCEKIEKAVYRAMVETQECGPGPDMYAKQVAEETVKILLYEFKPGPTVSIEDVQDAVEYALMKLGYRETAKAYIFYRQQHQGIRQSNKNFVQNLEEIFGSTALESNMKRDNANVDGNTSMGCMLQVGSVATKFYTSTSSLVTPEQRDAHQLGDIHIHDLDFYPLTTTCCQIDIAKLLKGGFSTGHGYLREPSGIQTAAALACIAIQSNQNDQHGGQGIPNLDYGLGPYVDKTFAKEFLKFLDTAYVDALGIDGAQEDFLKQCIEDVRYNAGWHPQIDQRDNFDLLLSETICMYSTAPRKLVEVAIAKARMRALRATEKATHQAMEALVHNLNSMHSRAGAQVPFSSINYGTDTSEVGRMVVRNLLRATEEGLGHGETPIFPIQIFKLKEGVSLNPGDPNYDLFELACKVSAKRLFPNFVNLDAPFNAQYYVSGRPETEVVAMGCRTRVIANIHDPNQQTAFGRGNLSFTSINLPRLGLYAESDEEKFFAELEKMLELVSRQLLDRFKIQAKKRVENYPFLMGQGIWLDSDKLGPKDEVGEVLKHGTLSIGFIGLAETLVALYGHHHGEMPETQEKGLAIVKFMRDFCDAKGIETGMNFSLLATPAEGLAGRFTRMDKKVFGEVPGVTDRDYYTNSFHVPVYYPAALAQKIDIEAPYHAICNAGHITYVELDGDTAKNTEAFMQVVRYMHDAGVGYGSINHPVDRDPVCGFVGVIDEECPRCGRREGEGLSAEKLAEIQKQYPNGGDNRFLLGTV